MPTFAAGRALLVQVVALLLTMVTTYFLARMQIALLSLPLILVLQGVLAAFLAIRLRQAPWWPPMHFLFPVAVAIVDRWDVPPTVFLACFALLLGLFWTTFRTQVPFYPSTRKVWDAMLATLPDQPLRIIDVGSGMGGLALHLARHRTDAWVCGTEVAPFPFLVSWFRSIAMIRCRFQWCRYETVDLSHFDVVFAYLSPVAMPALWEKACREMRPGTLFYSFEFIVPAKAPQQIIAIEGMETRLYRWTM